MVIVFADKKDTSATLVLDFFLINHVEFIHVNEDDQIKIVKIDKSSGDYIIRINEKFEVNLQKCTVWNRKSNIFKETLLKSYIEDRTDETVNKFYFSEISILTDFIIKTLPRNKLFGKQLSSSVNKLLVLEIAKKIGLNIPTYHIIGENQNIDKNKKYITKSISEILILEHDDSEMINYCIEINQNNLPNEFFPSLIQEKITKIGDVRLFIFNNLYYSCLTYSDTKETDGRKNYDLKSTRYLPYTIDKKTLNKTKSLLNNLGLDIAAIDFVLDENGTLWFLEVNPEGQYGYMECYCNYEISKQIASKLIKSELN